MTTACASISAPESALVVLRSKPRALAIAQGDLLLFCDADDVVDKHWVQSMASALADLDVVGGAR